MPWPNAENAPTVNDLVSKNYRPARLQPLTEPLPPGPSPVYGQREIDIKRPLEGHDLQQTEIENLYGEIAGLKSTISSLEAELETYRLLN